MKKLIWGLNCLLAAITATAILSSNVSAASTDYVQFQTNVPSVSEDMMKSDFWINNSQDVDKVIMNSEEIEKYNKSLQQKETEMVNLQNYKEILSQNELKNMILSLSSPASTPRYDKDGKQATKAYYDNLSINLNLDSLKAQNRVQYGVTVRRTEMKTYPSEDLLFKEGDNYEFDRLMETAVYPIEPLIILSTSKDNKWFFVQSYNYLAWIPAEDVAITTKDQLFNYVNAKNFLVTTGKRVFTVSDPLNSELSELKFDMGVKIPLASQNEIGDDVYGQNPAGNYVVKLPTRDEKGNMVLKYALISKTEDVNVGYLPYTKRIILNQAFKFLGERYGWGGMFDGRDCSALIEDIYRSMGIRLPRNADQQEEIDIGQTYNMPKEMTLSEREALFDSMDVGTGLYMPGHTMLYIGKYNGEHYMIHDFSGFYKKGADGKYKYYRSRQVMVTPVTIGGDENGKTFLEEMTSAKKFTLDK